MKHVVFCLEKVKQEIKIMKGKRTTENRMGKMLSNVGKNAKEIVERSKDLRFSQLIRMMMENLI